ncbi:very short patch repair endonuclease [Paraburkholderia haematera]|uniref:very short patch repair endonuclease n=1 Tax=Paraburkholderia haematera TaxID=2793077 RepID=UPI001B8D3D23|nr:very short patch repair endonuclease [Paraburkholderia haematera]
MDKLSREKRSWLMSRVTSKNTTPELFVRGLLHRMGYRFRLHGPNLRGRPDIVFSKKKKVIFVHGCFWHGHRDCRLGRLPRTNLDFWAPKIERTRARDTETVAALEALGWKTLVVWQCELKNVELLTERLEEFLGTARSTASAAH